MPIGEHLHFFSVMFQNRHISKLQSHSLQMGQILSFDKFNGVYHNAKQTHKGSAGAIALNPLMTKILLTHGRYANKWGCPKGHEEEEDGDNFVTFEREFLEETGHKVEPMVPVLPYVIINKIKLYCIIVPENTRFQVRDTNEIDEVKWFDLEKLRQLVILSPNKFNASVRGLFEKPNTIDNIKTKMLKFNPNYIPSSGGKLCGFLHRIIADLKQFSYKTHKIPIIVYHYICYYLIQKYHYNVFTPGDLIAYIRDNLN